MVEGALLRIGQLLQVGFGEAGAAIIARNVKSRGGKINALIPGEKVSAVFGFCDVRKFTAVTEYLQQDVMVFVNVIADIVHTAVARNGGSPNKNIGDAFLLVWKDKDEASNIPGDRALRSFLEAIVDVKRNPYLHEICRRPDLQECLGEDFSVDLGFGLHFGWAIEGAIGSSMKVDASYLSPHVNISSRLEAATKQYGVMILLSGEVMEHVRGVLRFRCRRVDRVTVKGSSTPLDLYTYDVIDPFSMQMAVSLPRMWDYSEEAVLGPPSTEYTSYCVLFNEGVKLYIEGEWEGAKRVFEECERLCRVDPPRSVLTSFMAERGWVKPEEWEGYRALTEK